MSADTWFEFMVQVGGVGGFCGLCGNTGFIDTNAAPPLDPRGVPVPGLRRPCICPNGRGQKRRLGLDVECARADTSALPPVKIEPAGARAWRYSEPNRGGEGWWVAFMDSSRTGTSYNGGHLSIQSDYGDYSYCWGGVPAHQTLPQFLVGCGPDYILGKLAGRRDWVDVTASKKKLRAAVIAFRRENRGVSARLYLREYDHDTKRYVSKDQHQTVKEAVASAWDLVRDVADPHGLLSLLQQGDLEILGDAHDLGDYYVTGYEPQARAFVAVVWPRIVAALVADGHGPAGSDKGSP